LTNTDIGKNCDAGTDGRPFSYDRGFYFPVTLCLQVAADRGCPGITVIHERHTVSDKDVVFDRDAFADEAVAGYFAAPSYLCILLNLYESSNLGFVADFTAIEVDEPREPNIGA